MSRIARWRLMGDDGRPYDANFGRDKCGAVPEPYGTKARAAEYLAWLMPELGARGAAWIEDHLVRVDLPGLAKSSPQVNVLAEPACANRKETA